MGLIFRSFKTAARATGRAHAAASSIPADWSPDALKDVSRWSYRITDATPTTRRRGRGGAPQRRRHGRHPQGGFPAQGVRRGARRRAARADGRPRHRDDAGFPARPLRPPGAAIAYIGLGAWLGQTMSQNKLGPHPRPREGPRRRLQRTQYPRLHDQRRDALPHRRLRLCRAALPADAEVRRREPDRELGDGLQHACCSGGPSWSKVLARTTTARAAARSAPATLPYFKQPIFSFHGGLLQCDRRRRGDRQGAEQPGVPKFTPCRRRRSRSPADRRRDARSTSTSSAATSSSSTIRDAAHPARIRRLAGGGAQAPSAAAVALRSATGRPIPRRSARPLRPRRQRQGRAAHRPAQGGSGVDEAQPPDGSALTVRARLGGR